MKQIFSNLSAIAWQLILGALLTLAFAPFGWSILAILSQAIWLITLNRPSLLSAFSRGFFFGLGFFSSSVYWVFNSIYIFGGVPIYLAILFTFFFVAILSLFPALLAYI